jgi:hypothetical protein
MSALLAATLLPRPASVREHLTDIRRQIRYREKPDTVELQY